MTLDEAIAHAREVAKEKRKDYERACALNVPSEGFCECASEHEQLASWLEELAEYQKLFESPKEAEEVLNMLSV